LQHPDVLAVQQNILAACVRHGVAAGIHVLSLGDEQLQRRLAEGFRFIACGIDTLFIQQGCRAMLEQFSSRHNGKTAEVNRLQIAIT
jgi:2-keto-3-deoxy-L-rhamnonate aldolase RhmA